MRDLGMVVLKRGPWEYNTGDSQADKELSRAGLMGQWVAKGNPPGFLDSEDEAELEEAAGCRFKKKGDYISPEQWREIGEFLFYWIGVLLGAIHPEDEICVMDELLGEFDGE